MPTSSGSTGGASGRRTDPPGAPRRIVLVGFMAAGKSTVGRLVARRLDWPFVDLDAQVERIAGLAVPEIFRRKGEEAFRELEARVTRELDLPPRAVVAAGGGWMAREELRDRWSGAVRVWLDVGPEEALARLEGDLGSRPMLGDDPESDIRRLMAERRPDYERAEARVVTDCRTAEEVAGEVIRAVGAVPGHAGPDAGTAPEG